MCTRGVHELHYLSLPQLTGDESHLNWARADMGDRRRDCNHVCGIVHQGQVKAVRWHRESAIHLYLSGGHTCQALMGSNQKITY